MSKFGQKLSRAGHGRLSVLITAGVILLVLLLNILFSLATSSGLAYLDMTREVYQEKFPELKGLYSLTDACRDLLQSTYDGLKESSGGQEVPRVRITFCDDPDVLLGNTTQRYVYYTALALQHAFPKWIEVECIDVYNNASAVQKYKTNSASNIYASQVIVSSGTEFRVLGLRAFYVFSDNTSSAPWAYNGEKYLTSSIIAVTKAESPIACFTNNHGESAASATFWALVENAGYRVQYLDLENEEIPEDCRLLISLGPTRDYRSRFDGDGSRSEIEKLDKFLDKTYAFVVFFNSETPVLRNLEEYLSEWGIVLERSETGSGETYNYLMRDSAGALSSDLRTILGTYTVEGGGSSITTDMRSGGVPRKVVFRDATSISYDKTYQTQYMTPEEMDSLTETYAYASRYSNGVSRIISDVFIGSETATAWLDDGRGEEADAGLSEVDLSDRTTPFRFMTLTTEAHSEQETNYTSVNHTAYVLACTSTEFVSDTLLQSEVYGNTDVMLAALRSMGKEIVAVNLSWKPFNSATIGDDYQDAGKAWGWTVALMVIPGVICLVLGTVVVIKRRYH